MVYNTVLVDQEKHVGVITLNRPEAMNTFSTEMAKELNQALIQLDNDPDIRVVVVKGAGKAFSVGIDVTEFFGKSQKEYREWVGIMEQMNHVIGKDEKAGDCLRPRVCGGQRGRSYGRRRSGRRGRGHKDRHNSHQCRSFLHGPGCSAGPSHRQETLLRDAV